MQSHTKKWQRITIWVIAIAMAVGTLGFYFMIILQNEEQANPTAQTPQQTEAPKEDKVVDPTAYKTTAPVNELQKTDLVVGTGDEVKAGDTVRVHYKGTIAQTGVKFDSSYDRGEPITFPLGDVIKGWQDGMPGMKVGGKRRLVVPAAQAYGEQGAPPTIEPNSDLVFEVELLAVNPAQ